MAYTAEEIDDAAEWAWDMHADGMEDAEINYTLTEEYGPTILDAIKGRVN